MVSEYVYLLFREIAFQGNNWFCTYEKDGELITRPIAADTYEQAKEAMDLIEEANEPKLYFRIDPKFPRITIK